METSMFTIGVYSEDSSSTPSSYLSPLSFPLHFTLYFASPKINQEVWRSDQSSPVGSGMEPQQST